MSSVFPQRFLVGLFGVAGLLGLVLSWYLSSRISSLPLSVVNGGQVSVTVLVGLGVLLGVFLRGQRRVVWEVVFLLALFLGTWYLGLLLLPWKIALFLASFLTLGHVLLRNVLLHNLFYLTGALGIAVDFAGTMKSELLLVLLVAFTAYDILAAQPGGPIVALASRLLRWGLVPGFIIPAGFKGLFQTVDEAIRSRGALLGAGDVILPMAVLMRASLTDLRFGMVCFVGLIVGAFFVSRGSLHPRAALPPLAIGVAIPFVLLLVVGYFLT